MKSQRRANANTGGNAPWAELLQLAPVISLALPFILAGKVDLAAAGSGFLLGAALSVPVTALVLLRGEPLNPVLLGTGLWLWFGALAFGLELEGPRSWLSQTQAFGLFVGALVVGIGATFGSATGYLACRGIEGGEQRRASLVLLGLSAALLVWAWVFRSDVRLGGGLPFIVLNVTRRGLMRRALRRYAAANAAAAHAGRAA